MDGCEGNLLTAMPEGHWVKVGNEWVNMALVTMVKDRSGVGAGPFLLCAYRGDAGAEDFLIDAWDADAVLAYLAEHQA